MRQYNCRHDERVWYSSLRCSSDARFTPGSSDCFGVGVVADDDDFGGSSGVFFYYSSDGALQYEVLRAYDTGIVPREVDEDREG